AALRSRLHARPDGHAAAHPVRQHRVILPVSDGSQFGGPTMAVTPPVSAPGANFPRSGRPRRQNLFWSRLHFVLRLLGLTGVLVGCAGLVLAAVKHELDPLRSVASWSDAYAVGYHFTQDAFEHAREQWRTVLLLVGAATALFALLVEVLVVLGFT